MTKEAAIPRFDGAATWATLPPEVQAKVGALALELGVAMAGEDSRVGLQSDWKDEPIDRALEAAINQGFDQLRNCIPIACPGIVTDEGLPPVPSLLGQVCRRCGCSDNDACADGCAWIQPDLCSACVEAKA